MATSGDGSRSQYKHVFTVLFQLTKKVNEGGTLNDILKMVAEAATDLVDKADSCSIMLLDDSKQELLSKASHGLSPQEGERITFQVGCGVAGWVVEHGSPALIPDVAMDGRFQVHPDQVLSIRSMLSVPLATPREGIIGVITLTSPEEDAFQPEDEALLSYLGASIVKDIENARLYCLAITDTLTKAYNRQYLFQRLPQEIDRVRRYKSPLSVILADIDHFKVFNDTYGHLAGDFVLKEVVRLAKSQIRDVDMLVRYGGEELLFILPNTGLEGAMVTAERVRRALDAAAFPWSNKQLHVTVSMGVAQYDAADSDEEFLKRADQALYLAKSQGRNCVRAHETAADGAE